MIIRDNKPLNPGNKASIILPKYGPRCRAARPYTPFSDQFWTICMHFGKSAANFDIAAAESYPTGRRTDGTPKLPALFPKCMHCRLNWPEKGVVSPTGTACRAVPCSFQQRRSGHALAKEAADGGVTLRWTRYVTGQCDRGGAGGELRRSAVNGRRSADKNAAPAPRRRRRRRHAGTMEL